MSTNLSGSLSWGSSLWGLRRGWRSHFFFWFFHLGWVVTLVVVPPWGTLGVGVVWVPLGCAGVYAAAAGVGLATGVLALWLSLVGFALVGGHCVGWYTAAAGVVTPAVVVDPVGVPYLFLTVSLLPLVVLASLDSIRKNEALYYFWVLLLGGVLGLCFCVKHFLVFYVLFEVLGFPMFLLIGQYGPRIQRVGAAYKFFAYTFGGSAFILPVLVYLQFWLGSTDVFFLRGYQFTEYEQVLFFGLCSVPFAVKIPLVPFHLWLPEAHVEAPTPISMLLAGLLLKTGGYAFLRFLLPVFPVGVYVWGPFLTSVGLFSVLLGSVYALVQVDMKKMIAYASVAHMSLVFLGLFSGVTGGVQGATYLMLAHGYTSAGLFAGIGVLYDRYHTRTIRYYGGLVSFMPVGAVFFFVLTLGNLSFPFTGGFTGEFMILAGLATHNFAVCLLAGSTVFLSLCYSVWLFNRLFYGLVGDLHRHRELTPPEVGVLGWCTVGCLGLGWGGGNFAEHTHTCYVGVLLGGVG